jgi:RNA polymerase sigma-70 factor (ECF subfamily)
MRADGQRRLSRRELDIPRPDADFLALINKYRGVMQRVSRMYAANGTDREDLVQEIVYQLWRSFPSFRRDAAPMTWVYRIALNTAITGLRRRSRRPVHVPIDAAVDVPTPSASAGLDSRIDLLYCAIRRLGDVDRALVMCYLDELSYKQIADVLGLSESNVGVRLGRARARLQDLVRDLE